MAGYTLADYEREYVLRVERYLPKHYEQRDEVRLHYIYHVMRPYIFPRWNTVSAYLGFDATTKMIIVGGGFGWAAERLEELFPGITIAVTDPGEHAQTAKGTRELTEINDKIVAVGLALNSERAILIRDTYLRTGNRDRVPILNEDLNTVQSRQTVRDAAGGAPIDYVFTEDIFDTQTDAEIIDLTDNLDQFGAAEPIHIISREYGRSASELRDLTGQRVIVANGGGVHQDRLPI